MRKPKEIEAEIEAIKACKSYAPARTMFGDDNHRKLDLQMEYLRGEIDITTDEFEEEYNDDEKSAILEARDWQEGDSDESPSSGWDSYKKPKPAVKPATKKGKSK